MSQYRRPAPRAGYARQTHPARRRAFRRGPMPLWLLAIVHVCALGVALVLYALPHHVIPRAGVAVGITSTRASAARAAVEAVAPVATAVPEGEGAPTAEAQRVEPSPEPTVEAATVGDFRAKFADHFTDGTVERTDTTYRSANLDISITSGYDEANESRYYVADIYIADIDCLATALAKDQFGNGYAEWPSDIAKRFQSVVTINGDYYGARQGGIVIRNGTLYRDEKNMSDVAVIYWDGTMKTFDPWAFNAEAEMANGAYQCWDFGPALLDDTGAAKTAFNSTVNKNNPRSVIGYYEPGHYCFVAVDGRSGSSKGLYMADLAKLMESLGCTQAYNLDGGQSSMLCAGTTVVNKPYKGGRKTSDVIMILDGPAQ